MGMDSYLEIFTTVYGWTVANLIYGMLLDTGIVFVPLIITIISVWKDAHVEGTENGSAERAVRMMEIELGVALFVMSLCFVPTPWTTLDRAYLTFQPAGTVHTPAPPTVAGGSTGTTYDMAFAGGSSAVPVPLWWYTIMGLSSGVNSAVRAGISNSYLGLRQAEQLAQLATIQDPRLRAEAQAFRDQCFVPAHARFHSPYTEPSDVAKDIAKDSLYGKDDTEWIGSKTFLDDPDYYASFRARQAIAGFESDPDGDDSDAAPGDTTSMPNCRRWWLSRGVGLRDRLIMSSGSTFDQAVDHIWGIMSTSTTPLFSLAAFDKHYVQDQILRQALWRNVSNYVQTDQVLGGENNSRWSATGWLSNLGIAMKSAEASFSYYPIIQFMTMVQPIILMAIYMFLPLLVVFSRYSLSMMMYGAIGIFTVKFWAAMFAIAKHIDERLVAAMYGDSTVMMRELITNGLDGGSKRMVLNVVTLGLFIGLPLVWAGMMGWIGIRVGSGLDRIVSGAFNEGAGAGSATLSVANRVAGVVSRLRR